MQKRSLVIAGHRTSIALEPEFWSGIEQMADVENIKVTDLIIKIDKNRDTKNLTSALRVAILKHYRS